MLHSEENVEKCWDLICAGVKQHEIAKTLRLSRSTTSRLCRAAAKKNGNVDHRRFLREHGAYENLMQFLFPRIEFGTKDDCWGWKSGKKPNGYGSVNFNGTGYQAHRAVYECLVGPIPDGLVIDHLCGNPGCVNPYHLKPSLQAENLLRRASKMDYPHGAP
ncbi:HNH endonuclease signature motif containing protein [Rhizobium sp. N122]|uniref:HNH endonuclease signature motif containing protein n=1 Tax=Rhizobium sp. N122 TaxID=1764272 RepID=UPI001AECAF13|nr:HNH endonuclease signature motif containing protein [Rhizobium sp. N122]